MNRCWSRSRCGGLNSNDVGGTDQNVPLGPECDGDLVGVVDALHNEADFGVLREGFVGHPVEVEDADRVQLSGIVFTLHAGREGISDTALVVPPPGAGGSLNIEVANIAAHSECPIKVVGSSELRQGWHIIICAARRRDKESSDAK